MPDVIQVIKKAYIQNDEKAAAAVSESEWGVVKNIMWNK